MRGGCSSPRKDSKLATSSKKNQNSPVPLKLSLPVTLPLFFENFNQEMETERIPEVVLSSGHKMPVIGLGTFSTTLSPPEVLTSVTLDAIEVGYRHIDTAAIYGTEEAVGGALAHTLESGLLKSRDEIFITSKLWCSNADRDLVLPGLKGTLERLGLDFVDLYLIHWPARLTEGADPSKFSKTEILPLDIIRAWEAMQECVRLGLAKSIGVSNFSAKKISQLLQHATIPPSVEMNAAWQQKRLVEFCKEKRIHTSAWSPLAANGASWGSLAETESPVLKEIAAANGRSVAQIALRWVYEQGATAIVKSFNGERMKERLQIFEWELTPEELEKIKQIRQQRGYTGEAWAYEAGPTKSVEEIWDDDEA